MHNSEADPLGQVHTQLGLTRIQSGPGGRRVASAVSEGVGQRSGPSHRAGEVEGQSLGGCVVLEVQEVLGCRLARNVVVSINSLNLTTFDQT